MTVKCKSEVQVPGLALLRDTSLDSGEAAIHTDRQEGRYADSGR